MSKRPADAAGVAPRAGGQRRLARLALSAGAVVGAAVGVTALPEADEDDLVVDTAPHIRPFDGKSDPTPAPAVVEADDGAAADVQVDEVTASAQVIASLDLVLDAVLLDAVLLDVAPLGAWWSEAAASSSTPAGDGDEGRSATDGAADEEHLEPSTAGGAGGGAGGDPSSADGDPSAGTGAASPPATIVETVAAPPSPSTVGPPTVPPPATEAPSTASTTAPTPTPTPAPPPPTTTTAPPPPATTAPTAAGAGAGEPVPIEEPTPGQWAQLRSCESGGDYTVISGNGRYFGAYQFSQPTWDWLAAVRGRPDLVGMPPNQASPADQDAMALLLWQRSGPGQWPSCGAVLPERR